MTIVLVGLLCLFFPWLIPAVVGYLLGGVVGAVVVYLILGAFVFILAGLSS